MVVLLTVRKTNRFAFIALCQHLIRRKEGAFSRACSEGADFYLQERAVSGVGYGSLCVCGESKGRRGNSPV